jgi:hypothetical protein
MAIRVPTAVRECQPTHIAPENKFRLFVVGSLREPDTATDHSSVSEALTANKNNIGNIYNDIGELVN